jgi:hypothetical protein
VTVIRWAEGVFIVFAFAMIGFLPIPPHGAAIVSYVTISAAIVAAGFVWWGLRSPTPLPWRVAAILAGVWSLLWLRNVVAIVRSVFGIAGAATHQGLDPVFLGAILMSSLPSVAQLVVLCAWVMASRVR